MGSNAPRALPVGWRSRLSNLVVPGWSSLDEFCEINPWVCDPKTLVRAEKKYNNHMTEKLLHKIAAKLNMAPPDLLLKLGKDAAPTGGSKERLKIADVGEVLSWGWDPQGHRLLDELIAIDHEVFDGLSERDEGKTEQWAPVFMHHPDTWRLLIAGSGEIVGYWHFVPLFCEEFERAKRGELYDSEVTADTVRPFELPGVYSMYITMFAVKAKYRHAIGVPMLFNSFLDLLADLATKGVFFDEVCANAYSKHGDALCRNFGMESTRQHVSTGRVYARSFFPFPSEDIFSRSPTLIELYAKRFADKG